MEFNSSFWRKTGKGLLPRKRAGDGADAALSRIPSIACAVGALYASARLVIAL